MSVRITCVDKPSGYIQNPHEAISVYGWLDESTQEVGRTNRPVMVNWVKQGGLAYVKDNKNDVAYCRVRNNGHTEFLQTVADNVWTDNLLSLPKCT